MSITNYEFFVTLQVSLKINEKGGPLSPSANNKTSFYKEFMELYLKATCLYDSNLYQEAAPYYAKILEYEPTNIIALCMLSVVTYKSGQHDKANTLAMAAHRLCPQLGLPRHILRLINQRPQIPLPTGQYRGFFDKDFVKGLYKTFMPDLKNSPVYYDKNRFDSNATKHIDQDFLYFMIRLLKPRNIIEFSPFEGLSTAIIYTALEDNKQPYTFATFDLEEFEGFTERMRHYNIPLRVIAGDAINTVPAYLKQNNLIGKIDFCFVDSEHTYEFASRYTKAIFPLLSDDCVIMFHDMCCCPEVTTEPFIHYGPVRPSEITGHINSYGEGAYISKFFRTAKGYGLFLTHRLFGGFGLLSPKLPLNMTLISELTKEVEGFSYKLSPFPNTEDRKITCMLIALPEKYGHISILS